MRVRMGMTLLIRLRVQPSDTGALVVSPGEKRRQGMMTKLALRLRLMPLLAAMLLISLMSGGAVLSQDKIVSSSLGELPTTGGARPGPVGAAPDPVQYRTGALPVAIEIADAFV